MRVAAAAAAVAVAVCRRVGYVCALGRDMIHAVDGYSVYGLDASQVTNLIRGTAGTQVRLQMSPG